MAEEDPSTDQKIKRQVGRSIANWLAVGLSLGLIGSWLSTGFYTLQPGEAAVILRFGAFSHTERDAGLRWHLPPPIEFREVLNYSEVRREDFGGTATPADAAGQPEARANAIQTTDNNIVTLDYVVQYEVRNAFAFVYRLAQPVLTLRDASEAAVREVIGSRTLDQVLSEDRAGTQKEAASILQETLDSYFGSDPEASAFHIRSVQLQDVQPPAPVQDAFADVIAALQDDRRARSEAEGDAEEIRERASAQAKELREAALAYQEAKLLEADGEARRFEALLTEYQRAPEVTRRRLYLETMEEILPKVEKVIVDPDAVQLMPWIPMDRGSGAAAAATATPASAPPPVADAAAEGAR